ncbi:phosphate ABC transporter permease subunit PstC [Kosmotoga olearia]|uniref:Phosphate transport system permease protein n=1 Tax=Kosmotoga olearia (strain ATCC BAA-1733 / DSM 21960 / TBF 19.5.1) TaxID=521045 RepID=C5CFK8_KOSOT|nr:phosphate ABC transporter permease subunit PstC [Kosmotoga olearia]ACR79426.1 phosphate ABC transporter, inner membrane subunit PstC [Kosmotoga olearia TBF 19.5.1]
MKRYREATIKVLVFVSAFLTTVIVFGILYFLVSNGISVFKDVSLKEFFLSSRWFPTYEDPEYGILALFVGTLSVTGLTLVFSIPLGFIIAVYMSEYSSRRTRELMKFVFELTAGIPSVVLGAFGLKYVSQWIMNTFPDVWTGLNIFNASLVLSILAMPYFVTFIEDALSSVPKNQREASLALGANKTRTVFKVVVPQARSGILNAIILGTNRVIGETMVVLMVSGGATMIPSSIFDPVRPLTSAIAGEMGEVELGGTHYHALFMIGVVLLVISTLFTIIAMKLKGGKEYEAG